MTNAIDISSFYCAKIGVKVTDYDECAVCEYYRKCVYTEGEVT